MHIEDTKEFQIHIFYNNDLKDTLTITFYY